MKVGTGIFGGLGQQDMRIKIKEEVPHERQKDLIFAASCWSA
jgi:hypothetical protein